MTNPRKMPTKKAIKMHWANRLVNIAKFDSIEELFEADYCFACGTIDDKDGDDEKTQYTERAHIIARCNGGDDTVENLHLLCSLCHKASEFIEDDDYAQWFMKRNAIKMMIEATAHKMTDHLEQMLKGAK
jgi:hypothetical protein